MIVIIHILMRYISCANSIPLTSLDVGKCTNSPIYEVITKTDI